MGDQEDVAATRRSYDERAGAYVDGIGTAISPATEAALDRSILRAFAATVQAAGAGARVADVGCGPGRAAAFLREHAPDLDPVGIDLSLALLQAGRVAPPGCRSPRASWRRCRCGRPRSPGSSAGTRSSTPHLLGCT